MTIEAVDRDEKRRRAEALAERMKGLRALRLSDPIKWGALRAANGDEFGREILDLAENWGRLMQSRMVAGKLNYVDEFLAMANIDGLDHFAVNLAGSVLCQCWAHGDALRRWKMRLDTGLPHADLGDNNG